MSTTSHVSDEDYELQLLAKFEAEYYRVREQWQVVRYQILHIARSQYNNSQREMYATGLYDDMFQRKMTLSRQVTLCVINQRQLQQRIAARRRGQQDQYSTGKNKRL